MSRLEEAMRPSLALLCTCLLVWQLVIGLSAASANSWWSLALGDCGTTNARCSNCSAFSSALSTQQRQLCRSDIPVRISGQSKLKVRSISQGIREAIIDCQLRFNNSKWNCSTFEGPDPYGAFINNGTRETAVLTAYMSAGGTLRLARDCHLQLLDCPCISNRSIFTAEETVLYTCNDNIPWALKVMKDFVEVNFPTMEPARDVMDQHNSNVGRKLVNRTNEYCVCHGISGSCSVKTCFNRAPDMSMVGEQLRSMYTLSSAQLNYAATTASNKPQPLTSSQTISADTLVYLGDSPSFCNANFALGIPGVRGRICSSDSNRPDSCDALCCGRRASLREIRVPVEECSFVWCCRIECRIKEYITVTEYRCT